MKQSSNSANRKTTPPVREPAPSGSHQLPAHKRKPARSVRRLAQLALMTVVALSIFIVELQLPPLTAIPGVKLGLANIVTLAAFYLYGRRDALLILVTRVVIGAFATGQMMTLPYSLFGGLVCYFVCALLFPLFPLSRLWLLSMIGAVFHNLGQIVIAIIVTSTPEVIWYFPILCISGLISGCFTGLTAQYLLRQLKRISRSGHGLRFLSFF